MANLFDKFGGVRPMAEHLNEPPSTVQSWKSAGRVPATHQPRVLDKAEALGLNVTAEDVVFPLADRVHGGEDVPADADPSPGNPADLSAAAAEVVA